MKHPVLKAENRTVLGKKVKKLRREGLLPANVYGKGLASKALQVKLADFLTIYKEVGETGLVDLQIDGKAKPVLIKNLQMNFQTRTPLHTDFYQVNLKEKIKAMVPVHLTGEAKAVAEKVGMLLQTMSEIEVEALPDKLPEHIEVNIENLSAVDDHITVADVVAPEEVIIATDPNQTIVRITEFAKVEEPEVEAEAEAETPAEGETKPEETAGENPQTGTEEQKGE